MSGRVLSRERGTCITCNGCGKTSTTGQIRLEDHRGARALHPVAVLRMVDRGVDRGRWRSGVPVVLGGGTVKIVWVYVDASRQRPWCALVGAFPAGRIVTGCAEFAYREIMTSTHEPNDLCCMECLRRVEAGLREPVVPLAIDLRPTADLRGPVVLDVEATEDWR